MWWKSNEIIFLHWIIILYTCRSVWFVNALSIVCSEMLKLSRNNQNIKMFGVPPNTLPLVIYTGIFCYWVLLHHNMSFKTIAVGLMVLSNGMVHFLKIKIFFKTNLPKLSQLFEIANKFHFLWLFQAWYLHIMGEFIKLSLRKSKSTQWPRFSNRKKNLYKI